MAELRFFLDYIENAPRPLDPASFAWLDDTGPKPIRRISDLRTQR